MSTVYLAGVDIELEWPGLLVAGVPGVLDRAQTLLNGVTVPRLAGQLPVDMVTVPPREFTIAVWISGATTAEARATLRAIQGYIGSSTITVRLADRADLVIYARCIGGRAKGDFPDMVSASGDGELVFIADHPYWRDLSASSYYLDSTARPLPGGNAPTSYILEIWRDPNSAVDCVNPSFTLLDGRGEPIRTSTFTYTIADNAKFIRVLTHPELMEIYKVESGTVTLANSLLTGGLFPKHLDPHAYANPYLARYLMGKVTASSGTAKARIIYPGQYV